MNILDEEQTNKVTYSSACQATFKKYKGDLIQQIVFSSIGFIIGFACIYGSSVTDLEVKGKLVFMFWLFVIAILLSSTLFMVSAVLDLKNGKLIIYKDIYLKGGMRREKNGNVYYAELKELGFLDLPPRSAGGIKEGTEVYAVFTGKTRMLLDVLPTSKADETD